MNTLTIKTVQLEDLVLLNDSALARIFALSRIALNHLETPEGQRDTESLAEALTLISEIAEFARDDLYTHTDALGSPCQHGHRATRRAAARQAMLSKNF